MFRILWLNDDGQWENCGDGVLVGSSWHPPNGNWHHIHRAIETDQIVSPKIILAVTNYFTGKVVVCNFKNRELMFVNGLSLPYQRDVFFDFRPNRRIDVRSGGRVYRFRVVDSE